MSLAASLKEKREEILSVAALRDGIEVAQHDQTAHEQPGPNETKIEVSPRGHIPDTLAGPSMMHGHD